MAEPATKVQSARVSALTVLRMRRMNELTETDSGAKNFATDTTKHHFTCIVDAVDFRVSELEYADDVVGPCCDDGKNAQANDAGDQAEDIEDRWNRENTQSDLSLHHEDNGPHPSHLQERQQRSFPCRHMRQPTLRKLGPSSFSSPNTASWA